jgi:putative transposase
VKKKRFSVEQLTAVLQQAWGRRPGRRRVSSGRDLRADVLPVEESYGSMPPSEARELKQLRDENTKFKRLVADLSLDKVMLQDVVQKKF